jgi:hypothetical protein
MAVISITVADAFDVKCNQTFGSNQAKKDAIKAYLNTEVRNSALRTMLAEKEAEIEALRAQILAAGDGA